LLAKLVALPCACKAKTTLVPSKQLTLQQVSHLDRCPFGAKIIKSVDITLGLPIASRHQQVLPCDPDGSPSAPGRHKHSFLLSEALTRSLAKISKRASRIGSTFTSGPRRALFWTAFCQSTLYYVTSVFALSNRFLKKLQRLQQKVLLGARTWIPMQHLASVFAMFKIGPCSQVHISCQKANLAAVLRMYGHQELLTSSSRTSMMQRARKSLESFSSADVLRCSSALTTLTSCAAAPYTKAAKRVISKFLGEFQTTLKERCRLAAVAHIEKLAQKSPFTQAVFALSVLWGLFANCIS
jgi:hypothetical protein